MICGVDCRPGDANCNGYCNGKTDSPPNATEAQKIDVARKAAQAAADAAEKAWYELAGLLEVGADRTRAFQVYENLRHARRL